jgi:hypothetical protein
VGYQGVEEDDIPDDDPRHAGTFEYGSKLLKEIGIKEARLIKRIVEAEIK